MGAAVLCEGERGAGVERGISVGCELEREGGVKIRTDGWGPCVRKE
jgi:hypothetical protein